MDGTVRVLLVADPAENRPDGNRLAADPAESLRDGNRLVGAPAGSPPDGNRPAAGPAGSLPDGNRPVVDQAAWINPGEVPAERVSPVAALVAGPVGRVDRVMVPAGITAWDRSPANPAPDKIRGLVILRESGEQSWREDPGGQAEQQESPGPPGG